MTHAGFNKTDVPKGENASWEMNEAPFTNVYNLNCGIAVWILIGCQVLIRFLEQQLKSQVYTEALVLIFSPSQ